MSGWLMGLIVMLDEAESASSPSMSASVQVIERSCVSRCCAWGDGVGSHSGCSRGAMVDVGSGSASCIVVGGGHTPVFLM